MRALNNDDLFKHLLSKILIYKMYDTIVGMVYSMLQQ
jgi:hypothetical protein